MPFGLTVESKAGEGREGEGKGADGWRKSTGSRWELPEVRAGVAVAVWG